MAKLEFTMEKNQSQFKHWQKLFLMMVQNGTQAKSQSTGFKMAQIFGQTKTKWTSKRSEILKQICLTLSQTNTT